MTPNVATALARAMDLSRTLPDPGMDGRPRVLFAVGDPQAPLEKFLSILDHQRLLGADGWLLPQVGLVSMGDHFDFGKDPAAARQDGLALLAWLAAHPKDQVHLLAGNHDLGRVGELVALDDATFAAAQAWASRIYRPDATRQEDEQALQAAYPALPTAELAARDFCGFAVAQRRLVEHLLRCGRMRAALAASDTLLLVHAGVTRYELTAVGLDENARAPDIAAALQQALGRAVAAWDGTAPLEVPGLHVPGSAALGEGGGMFYHRPAHRGVDGVDAFKGPLRRRYDPCEIPPRVIQAVGHIRDAKCRVLLAPFVVDAKPAREGALRHLRVTGPHSAAYAVGPLPDGVTGGAILFTDGGMAHVPAEDYALLRLPPEAQRWLSR